MEKSIEWGRGVDNEERPEGSHAEDSELLPDPNPQGAGASPGEVLRTVKDKITGAEND